MHYIQCNKIYLTSFIALQVKYYKENNFEAKGNSTMANNYSRKKIENYSFALNDAIGKGYSSQVYRGRNDDDNENVAVKVIDLKLLKNDINKILLQSEIQVLKQLRAQPHILNLHQVYTTKNNTYIITELCDSDLSKKVKKGLSQQQACTFMHQIIIGYLNFAKKQIIHRDLKPANILITESEELKIADFGFAIKVSDAHKYSRYNVGSPLYMAPQSLKRNEYTLKTDIWALGVIFYQLLTGQTPWKAKNQKELIKKIQIQKIEQIINKLNVNNQEIKNFLRKSLKIDKNLRMNVDDLQAFNFDSSLRPSLNILMEKKLNLNPKISDAENRLNFIISPKIDKNIENRSFMDRSSENRLSGKQYSEQKIKTLRYDSINKSLQMKPIQAHRYNASTTIQLTKRDSSAYKQNPEFIAPQPRLNTNLDQKKHDKKATSKILISEIHFCRFLYKLLTRISESAKSGLLQSVKLQSEKIIYDYMGIIKHKIENLINFKNYNYINTMCYEEYKESSDYQKLMKIAKQYKDRYNTQMKAYWNNSKCNFSTDNTLLLISSIQNLLEMKQDEPNFIMNYEKEIIVLDYLMTSKQLIDIFQNGQNYERFSRKSRIEEIVEGKTAQISWELYLKIINRSRQVLNCKRMTSGIEIEQKALLIVA